LTLKLTADIIKAIGYFTPENEYWQQLLDLVYSAPGQLTEPVNGSHFVFIGETGARETAQATVRLFGKIQTI
jgi:hypothetical protein